MNKHVISTLAGLCILLSVPAAAKDWFVAPGSAGNGSREAPFNEIQAAVLAAQPGDTVLVREGTYKETLRTVRDGSGTAPINIRAEHGRGSVIVTTPGTVLHVDHSFIVVDGLVLDGHYGPRAAVKVTSGIQSLVLRQVEVRRSSRDCITIGSAANVLIEDSIIHHCLNPANGRTDAHGIVASAVRGLTVRNTEIHTFSGDAIQLNRQHTPDSPAWDNVLIEGCRLWLAPLTRAENGFPAGIVPGENAVDTKVTPGSPRAHITIRDTQAWGFGFGPRQAHDDLGEAFNLKENIDATLDGVTVWDSAIAFRVRGSRTGPNGAWVRIQNAAVWNVQVGVRYEDDVQHLRVWNTTFGIGVGRAFEGESANRSSLDVRNVTILGAVHRQTQ